MMVKLHRNSLCYLQNKLFEVSFNNNKKNWDFLLKHVQYYNIDFDSTYILKYLILNFYGTKWVVKISLNVHTGDLTLSWVLSGRFLVSTLHPSSRLCTDKWLFRVSTFGIFFPISLDSRWRYCKKYTTYHNKNVEQHE